MGHTAVPSDNEVDLGVFAEKPGNLLEQICEASLLKKRMALEHVLFIFVFMILLL
ncbi:hypothetical protein Hanom_Chr00s000007g01615711 [Helianthus anomalus]